MDNYNFIVSTKLNYLIQFERKKNVSSFFFSAKGLKNLKACITRNNLRKTENFEI